MESISVKQQHSSNYSCSGEVKCMLLMESSLVLWFQIQPQWFCSAFVDPEAELGGFECVWSHM